MSADDDREHREDSRVRWVEHRQEHEALEADLRAHDRKVSDQINAALQTLIRHEDQFRTGVGSFNEIRQAHATLAAEVEQLKPKRKTWPQVAAAVAGFVAVIAGGTWTAANYLGERATLSDVAASMRDHVAIERPAIERVAAAVSDVQQEQAAQRQQIHDVKDDVHEIKSDLKEALRRGR